MGKEKKSTSAEGELIIWEEEGGNCSPYIGVRPTGNDELSIEDLIEKLIPGIEMGAGRKGVNVRVTFEIID